MPAYANAPMFAMPAYASTHARSGSTSSDNLTSPSPFDPTSTWPEWMLDDLDGASLKPLRGTASYQSLTAAACAVTAPAPASRPTAAPRRRQQQQQQQCKLAKLVLPRLSRPSTSDSEYSDAPHTPVSPWDDEPVHFVGRDGDFALASRRRDIYYPAPPVGLGFREATPAPFSPSPVEVVPQLASPPNPHSQSPLDVPVPVELVSAAPRRSHRLRRVGSKIALKLLAMVLNKLILSLFFKLMMRTGAPAQCIPALYVLLRVVSAARKMPREELVAGAAVVLAGLVCACAGALVVLSANHGASGVRVPVGVSGAGVSDAGALRC